MINVEQRIKRKGVIGRVLDWFLFRVKSRAWLIERLTHANNMLKVRTTLFAEKIRALDQNTTYYIYCDTIDEAYALKNMLNSARLQMKWTLPNILVTTRELEVKEDGKT